MNKLKGTSLFSNVGIAEAMLDDLNINICVANEIDTNRAEFYKSIYSNTDMICGDITNDIVRNKIIDKSLENKVDFIIATPPCQGMSVAGKRKILDERNQLIYYAIDVIERVKPRFVLIENVPKQLTTKIIIENKEMLIPDYIEEKLGNNYFINKQLIKCKDFGISQLRERSIMLLTLKETKVHWEFPDKEPEINLIDAIGHLPQLDPVLKEGLKETLKLFPNFIEKKEKALKISKWHTPPKHSKKHVLWMQHTPTGKSAIYNEVHFPKKENGERIKAHHNNYRRLKWDMPCRTITQNNGVLSSLATVHPGRFIEEDNVYSDARVLTIYEIMIVMSLPLDWPIPEGYSESFIRRVIGEGIPPLLIKKIFIKLLEELNE